MHPPHYAEIRAARRDTTERSRWINLKIASARARKSPEALALFARGLVVFK